MTNISDYDFKLPKELIAQQPLPCRSDARLMVLDRRHSQIHHSHVRDLADWLRSGDALVLNRSKVIPARLIGQRESSGGRWQGLFLDSDSEGNWKLLCKTRGTLHSGEKIVLVDRDARKSLKLRLLTKFPEGIWTARPESDRSTWEILDRVGRVPLPHYIRGGEMVTADLHDYQTVFASQPGSVAAPTAGLHFTTSLLEKLQQKGIRVIYVTLHVGIGTFRPISVERLEDHVMHAEIGEIDARQ